MNQEARMRRIEVNDDLFANVVDFSEAERAGFIRAFIDFWRREGSTRTTDDLRSSAERLLKGCQQHFRAGVTRLKRIGGVIPLGEASKFERMAHKVLELDDLPSFRQHSQKLLSAFPNIAPWLEWWLRDSHAAMLFGPYRQMDESLWTSLPGTTNAEEAMHWKIYAGIGRDQTLMSGLVSLYGFAGYYERLLAGAAVGAPIRYGQAEPWKMTEQRIGRTKPSRDPQHKTRHGSRYHNDGRPPDTRKAIQKGKQQHVKIRQKLRKKLTDQTPRTADLEKKFLTGRRPGQGSSIQVTSDGPAHGYPARDTTTVSEQVPAQAAAAAATGVRAPKGLSDVYSDDSDASDAESQSPATGCPTTAAPAAAIAAQAAPPLRLLPCYSQANNSCWLDVALQTLYVAVSNDFHSFEERIRGVLQPEHILYKLYECLDIRRSAEMDIASQDRVVESLDLQRDKLRQALVDYPKNNLVKSMFSMENAFVWLGELVRSARSELDAQFALTYFMGYRITIRSCTGADRHHFQVSASPRPVFYHQLTRPQYLQFDGSVAAWLKAIVQAKPQAQSFPCWRAEAVGDSGSGSPGCGHDTSVVDVYVCLPILLFVDLNQQRGQEWDCPDRITISQKTATSTAVSYHLVSRIFHSQEKLHYISRFRTNTSGTGRTVIYQYDSMALGGHASEIPGGKLGSHLAGRDSGMQLPNTFVTSVAVYQLHGGSRTQQQFLKARLGQLAKAPHQVVLSEDTTPLLPTARVAMSAPGMVRVPEDHCVWLSKTRRHTSGTVDYDLVPHSAPARRQKPKVTITASTTLQHYWPNQHMAEPTLEPVPAEDQTGASALPGKTTLEDIAELPNHEEVDNGRKEVDNPPVVKPPSDLAGTAVTTPAIGRPDHQKTNVRADSPFPLLCRCGASGDGNDVAVLDGLEAVECDECHTWSHVACQFQARASLMDRRDTFVCDECDPRYILGLLNIVSSSSHKSTTIRRRSQRSVGLSRRLTVGKGALLRVGTFWYPARLLKRQVDRNGVCTWRVKIWRLSVCLQAPPSSRDPVPEMDIRDEMWGDAHGRRQIRLGGWTMASTSPDEDADLEDPTARPYTAQIDKILMPHIGILVKLLEWTPDKDVPDLLDEDVPVLGHMRSNTKKSRLPAIRRGLMVHTGELSVEERCQIVNWIDVHIPGASAQRPLWMTGPLVGHAITLVLGAKLKDRYLEEEGCPTLEHGNEDRVRDRERYVLKTELGIPDGCHRVTAAVSGGCRTVNACAISSRDSFRKRSKAAGMAGYFQWGLDAGDLQDNWLPYNGDPSWAIGDFEPSDEDELLKEGPHYLRDQGDRQAQNAELQGASSAAEARKTKRPQPKPRPVKKR
ncbi:hypothetical protein NUW54_g2783 [Trametes sanguinea]|uniref:Uncharacterized protein n=1 Tax=Trametes sanguinea TaxID=158606 RepID=A0ACC1Q5E4_9APHY|nr:hypothetical protein NUW54_g2783 [Trametes sanguinea]